MFSFTRTNITTGQTYKAAFNTTHHEVFCDMYGKRTQLLKAKELISRWNAGQRTWKYSLCE